MVTEERLFFSFFTGALLLTWLYNASGGTLLAVVLFHASLDIAINTPAPSPSLQTGMGVLITLAGVLVLLRYGPRDLAPVARQADFDDATATRATEHA